MNWRQISELTELIESGSGIYAGDRIALIVEYNAPDGKPYKAIEILESTEDGWKCDSNPGTLPEFGESWCFERDLITPPAEQQGEGDPGRYETELAKCAEIVQRHHPIGAVKGIGLMEVATGLEELMQILNAKPVSVSDVHKSERLANLFSHDFPPPPIGSSDCRCTQCNVEFRSEDARSSECKKTTGAPLWSVKSETA